MRHPYVLAYCVSGLLLGSACSASAIDKLRVINDPGQKTMVMITDFNGGQSPFRCQNDQILRFTSEANVGNAVVKGRCNSELAIFSENHAMAFETGVATWTNDPDDIHRVSLKPILTVPVSVWIADEHRSISSVQGEGINANLLYNKKNMVGVRLNATIKDISSNAHAKGVIGSGCDSTTRLRNSQWHISRRLNVYYVPEASGGASGWSCGSDRNIIYVASFASLSTLAHEIGHAYGLGHTNGMRGFRNNNIMWGASSANRDHLSIGQEFRMIVDPSSMLNANGDRVGSTRKCAWNTASDLCPVLALD